MWLFISRHYEVSTHAPHARSDYKTSYASAISNVSTHAPHARSDAMSWACALHFWFQLTLLMRGATGRVQPRSLCLSFNSRSSCEERPIPSSSIIGFHQVSTHAPHARSDAFLDEGVHVKLLFQLTLLMRGATSRLKLAVSLTQFQLTLLMRGATRERGLLSNSTRVSTHAPHARSDVRLLGLILNIFVSTHAPHARSDLYRHHLSSTHPRFNSRSSCEERRRYQTAILEISSFNSRSSCEERQGRV